MNNNSILKIASNGGIGNRMRTMIGYAAVYKSLGKPAPQFIWKNTKHAPPNEGAFNIDGQELIDVEEIDDQTVMVPGTVSVPLLFRTHDLPSPSKQEELDAYGLIGFSDEIREMAKDVYHTAVHLRMSDVASADRFEKIKKRLKDFNSSDPVYLACDEQKYYLKLQKDFAVVNHSNFINISGSLRKTSIRDAAIDMMTCVKADFFLGCRCSSFSGMIIKIREFEGKDKHELI